MEECNCVRWTVWAVKVEAGSEVRKDEANARQLRRHVVAMRLEASFGPSSPSVFERQTSSLCLASLAMKGSACHVA
jgi:hypothetical protein